MGRQVGIKISATDTGKDMSDILGVIKGLGVSGGIGILLGVVFVSVVKPTTNGGVFLLIAIPTIFFLVVGGIIAAVRASKLDRAE
jgi:ABC-type antimicrobial peptide transport system permease subunit